jgi:hypothetical protein
MTNLDSDADNDLPASVRRLGALTAATLDDVNVRTTRRVRWSPTVLLDNS